MSNEAVGTQLQNTSSTPKSTTPIRFFDKYTNKVAPATNQVTLPKPFKKLIEEGNEGNFLLIPNEDEDTHYWRLVTKKVFSERLEANTQLNKEEVEELASSSIEVVPDNQGRFTLPKEFITRFGDVPEKEVVFDAAFTYVKMWTSNEYKADLEKQKMNAEKLKVKKAILKF